MSSPTRLPRLTLYRLAQQVGKLVLLSLVLLAVVFNPAPAGAQGPVPDPAKKGDSQPTAPPGSDPAKQFEGPAEIPPEVGVIPYTGPLSMPKLVNPSLVTALAVGVDLGQEVEPNGTAATATPLTGSQVNIQGNIFPANEVDFYSFNATAGDRVYAAVQTLFDASASGDSVLDLLNTDGTTVIESDPNDGTFNASSSTIAGATIPSSGTYFLRVRHNVATGTIRPYDLHFNRLSGAPTAEVEPNNSPAEATPLPASGWVSGTIGAVSPGESDFYSLTLGAGDSVYLSLDMNPERDANVWNGRLGFGLFGNPPSNQILLANDANAGAAAADPNSEAFFFTVLNAGTYYVYIDSIVAAGLGANATYNLSVAVYNPTPNPGTCTTYTNSTPVAIPTGPGLVTSDLTIPGNPRIADLDVSINLNHTFMQDLDVHLVSPAGNDNGLFTDTGAATVGGPQTLMDIRLDDEAALPFAFAMSAPFGVQPELAYRLGWFNGEDAGGTWTLAIRDDATGDGGTLNSWSLTICEPPASTGGQITLYSADFEAGDGGFTHSGTQDEWERGLPTFGAITTCNSGANCWKTDLDNSYNASSSQDLISPPINLTGLSGPIQMEWAMRYQLESANFDHVLIEAREVGNPANAVRVFDWLDATMRNTVGNPSVTIAESAGWSLYSADISALIGQNIELRFHLDSDTTVQLAGLAIDDVRVTRYNPPFDLTITKSVTPLTVIAGQTLTYTLTFANLGPGLATNVVLTDTVPVSLTNLSVVNSGATITDTGALPPFVWDVQPLTPGQGGIITITGQVSPTLGTSTFFNTATITATNDLTPTNNSASVGVQVLANEPEMAILGNGQVIVDGDTTPTLADHTDFGNVLVGQTLTRTFTISNSGVADLGLNALTIGGDFSDFTLTDVSANPIPPNGMATFEVGFNPTITGTRVATMVVFSDDSDESPYDFAIQAVGTIAPEIAILGNSQVIIDGDTTPTLADHTDFGNVSVGQTLTRTFTISNSGVTDLNLTLLQVSGPNAGDFGLAGSPNTPIAPNSTTTFQVIFTPTIAGASLATMTVVSDDSDESPYDFAIQGTGATTPPIVSEEFVYLPLILRPGGTPDLVVQQIIATSNNAQVVIRNQGTAAVPANVANEFWVDLYVNPVPAPTGVNQTCTSGDIVCESYAVWGVTQDLLPALMPGGVITLTVGDAHQTEGANPIALTPGSTIYAQVDSDNALTTYGAIQESDETNNISSILSTARTGAVLPSTLVESAPLSPYLPRRSH